ncbi:DUF3826 domain-containing protein [Actomonas aquatica]|uniref:DUF3826 domain-containing protein n=1 Tax=Actomonas aquatica TaxID=2866162 RepID=A0ABZ1C3Y9_9BACT|nr:DUF3826 domain-containing protein [Opitutus sp. WL0086]WRQ86062.1 DUF3826 domain-containing protein [Opitutus sp. WL0086]
MTHPTPRFLRRLLLCTPLLIAVCFSHAQTRDPSITDDAAWSKATEWVAKLELTDAAQTERVTHAVATHLQAVRAWHNSHPASTVPAGINPTTGAPLSDLDRSIIADSAMPRAVHDDLMTVLRTELSDAQVEAVLDAYTVGKVAFTLKGYHAIVPDLTAEEEAVILANLKEARERAIDFKNMKQISAIFEIYKTKNEQFLNANGRSWKQLYRDYVKAAQAKKAAEKN